MVNKLSDLEKVYLLRHIGIGSRKNKHTHIKILYALFLFRKNALKKGFKALYPGKELIAEIAGCSVRSVTSFVSSEAFKYFCRKSRKAFISNEYLLADWVISIFGFLEKKGVMKKIQTDFSSFYRSYKTYIDKCILKLMEDNPISLNEVMNKLSTKMRPILPTKRGRILPTTTRFATSMKPSIPKSNQERSPIPAVKQFVQTGDLLKNRFLLKDGDINMVMNSFSLRDIRGGIRIMDSWKSNGIIVRSPIATCLGAIKKSKLSRKNGKLLCHP